MELNELVKKAHSAAVEKGFWDNKREVGTLLMLIVSELGEALEADRKNYRAFWDSFCPRDSSNQQFAYHFERSIKDSFEDEIADALIRLFDLCGGLNIDIEKHIVAKMAYNETRNKMHGKNY